MESLWQFSVPVNAEKARSTGAFTSLPIRIHRRDDIANEATSRSLEDWSKTVGDGWEVKSGSCCSPVGNWGSFIFPESLPERLGVITYLASIGNVHDDLCDELDYEQAVSEHASLSHAMDVGGSDTDASAHCTPRSVTLKTLVGKALLEAIEMDKPRAMSMISLYRKKWLDVMERPDMDGIETLDEYFTFRSLNGGMEPYWALVHYGMAIDLSKEEWRQIQPIFQPAEAALILTNDYWSWDREWRAALRSRNPRIVNAIDLLMRTQGKTAGEAREAVQKYILAYEAAFLEKKTEFLRGHPEIPDYLRLCVEVCGAVVAGNHYWCANCPRHHAWRDNEQHDPAGLDLTFYTHTLGPANSSDTSDGLSSAPSSKDSEGYQSNSLTSPINTLREDGDGSSSAGQDNKSTNLYSCPCSDGVDENTSSLLDITNLTGPCQYITSMPSKGVRTMMIESLDIWFNVGKGSLNVIQGVVDILHHASLIMDDIEDGSGLRRGLPATHTVYGISRSVNSANFMFVQAVRLIKQLRNPGCLETLLNGLESLMLGQSYDLTWKNSLHMPTEAEYLEMVNKKTGGLFGIILNLMFQEARTRHSPGSAPHCCLDRLSRIFGQYFQIRDDYMNLCSAQYTQEKGMCEDLDEGKLSYPLIQLVKLDKVRGERVMGIMQQHLLRSGPRGEAELPRDRKLYIVRCMEEAGALKASVAKLNDLERELYQVIKELELRFRQENPLLRVLLESLSFGTA